MKRIFSLILALMAVQMMWGQTKFFYVTNTEESGEGSLRYAIEQATNSLTNRQIYFEIDFDMPDVKDPVINLRSVDFMGKTDVYEGELIIDGSTHTNGVVTISLPQTLDFWGQKITFKNIHFKTSSKSYLYYALNLMLYFENCTFDGNISLMADERDLREDVNVWVNLKKCEINNCKDFFYGVRPITNPRKFSPYYNIDNCNFNNSGLCCTSEYSSFSITNSSFYNTSLNVSPVFYESKNNLFYTASTSGEAYLNNLGLPKPTCEIIVGSRKCTIKGSVDIASIEDESFKGRPIYIQLYYTDKGKNTATKYLGSYPCDDDGSFEIEILFDDIDVTKKYGFSASAFYDLEYGLDQTSELSYFCIPDTTILSDTIFVGDKIDGQTYSKVGVYDVKSEILQNVNGCDSVVMHKVVVKPTALNYYVKTEKKNKGDGSNWENAMNGETFAIYLPLAPEGATFHVAEGRYLPIYEDGYGHKEFKVNSSVSIIGGYPDTAKTGDVPDPKEYKTIFTGDPSGDDKYADSEEDIRFITNVFDPTNDDLNVSHLFNAVASSSLSFYGCDFIGISRVNNKSKIASIPIRCNMVKLEKCEFDIVESFWRSDGTKASRLEASECIFRNRTTSSPSSIFDYETINIDRSLFDGVQCDNGGFFDRVEDAVIVTNSTFNNVFCASFFATPRLRNSNASKLYLLNNTFCNLESYSSNFAKSSDAADIKIVGNIFVNCSYTSVIDEVKDNCEVRDNLCSDNTVGTKLDLQTKNIDEVMEWESKKPVLKDNGGFTPTIALISDKLSDGKSIRFPRLEDVLTDQRGVSRDDMTCIGAYEISGKDTIYVRDTIVLGKTYVFNDKDITPAKIGIYRDTMVVKKGNKEITHILKLYVKPETSRNYFYVKKKAEGNGTGSSWNNAMSAEDFAFTLPFANSGTKFYVAEGVYNPIYDASGEESDDPTSLCYRIKNNITIYGGYPADAKIGATADPENHPTVFSGDHKGDDNVVKGVDENGRLKLTYSNRDDNSMQLFEANKCDVTFNNVIVDGAAYYGIIGNGDGIRFYGNNVTFQNCAYAVFYPNKNAVIFIDGSKFENISTGCLYTPSGWNTNVTSTVFSNNTGYIAYSASDGMMSFESVSVIGNNAQIYSANKGEFKVSNSEFIDNDNSGSLIYMYNNGDPYLFLNSKFINNKTPQSIIENNGGVMTVDNCSFKGNESGSNMIKSMAGLIVNHSSVSENKTPYDIFNTNKLTLISDTIESNSSVYIARPCVYGASIDSCFIKNNDSYLFHSSWSATDNWRFDLLNSEIVGNIKSEENPGVNITAVYVKGGGNSNDSVNIYRTKIEENSYENVELIRVQSANLDLDQSVISKNSTLRLLFCESSIVLVHNSSFFDNNVSQDVIETTHCWNGKHDHFINNTIASNSSKGDLFDNYYDNSSYVNNTIIGNKIDESLFKYPYDSLFVGNIVFGNTYSGFCYYDFKSDPSNNLIPLFYDVDPNSSSSLVIPNSTNIISDYYVDKYLANPSFSDVEGLKDIKDRSSEIASLFEGTYDATTGLFTPVLKDNGGFTPTVALKNNVLPDGTSITFPRLENVLTDQRGELRDDMTCMGAYELSKIDTVIVRDTIVLGKTYVFNDKEITPSKIGIYHDTMVVKKDNKEVTQVLKLYVKPYALFNCYVKKVAEGTGDGSSWENAMSGEDFAFVLPFAAVGADFYVAEGTYKPIYDELGYETDDSTSLCYRIKNNVSIYGGYPANAKTGATPDPENHPTIFTGDIKGDDKVVKGKDEDGRLELTYVNHDENATQLFLCDGKMTMVSLHDVIVDGASYGIIFTKKDPHLDTDNATFRNCYRAVYCPEGGAVVFTEDTKFENNSDYCLYTPNGWNTHISTTSFTGNTGYLVYTNSNMMSMDSVSVRGNNAQIYCTDISEFKISNSEFVDNENARNLFCLNNIDNTAMFLNVEFINNKIVQDVIGNYGSNGSRVMTVDNSIFKSNETGSYLINSTDGLIVRHSFVSDNQITSDMFSTYKLTLLSDTLELNKSKYIAYPCLSGASIDSCLIKNNDSYLFYSTKSSTDNWRFDLINSDIVDNYKTNLEKDNYVIYTESNMDSVNIARTKFIGNKYEESTFIHNTHSYFDFDECIVDSNYIFQFLYSALSQTNIFNSTFVGNNCNSLMLCQHSGGKFSIGNGVTLKNNTIVNNINKEYLYDGYYSKSTIVNNTIVGNTNEMYLFGKLYQSENTLVIGNILFGNINGRQQAYSGDERVIAIDIFDNNIMALDTSIVDGTVLSETNIISDFSFDEKVKKYTKQDFSKFKNHIDDVVSLFEGTYDATTGLFTPVLKNNGGFTPTVALKSDKLSDGTLIRFPRLEDVLTDQRGVSRFDETCMGAYELGCGSDTTNAIDTIVVGTKFVDGNVYEVGRHDSIFMSYKTAQDCDSVVNYTLFVTPDPSALNYYVKMKKEGDGDGRDWDNAMDSTDFATYLPLAPDGATFYVAAGTYKPKYGYNLQTPANKSGLRYEINSSVTIIGGYPADATGTNVPSEPKKYHTVFDGDIDGDDEISETKDNDYLSVSVTNRKDNSSYMFFSQSNKELHVGFDGISVKNSGGAVYILNPDKNVKISNSEFTYNNNAVYMPYEGENLEVYNSKFSKNFSNVIYMPTASNLTMDSILFENNQRNLVYIPGTSGVNPNHNVRLNRIYAYANGDSSAIVYSIGHDFVLSNSEFKNNRGLLYLYDNTRIDSTIFENNFGDLTKYGVLGFEINECSFIGNKTNGRFISSMKNGTELNHFSVTKSSFKNTISNGLLYVISDSIIVDSSEFVGSSKGKIEFLDYHYTNISKSNYKDNHFANWHFSGGTSPVFTNFYGNSIWNNATEDDGDKLFDFDSGADSVVITNNTIVSNVSGSIIEFHGCLPGMYNNTITGNTNTTDLIQAYPADLKLYGNIILGNSLDKKENYTNHGTETVYARWSSVDYKNNILPCIIDLANSDLRELDQSIFDENIFSIFDNTGNIHEELKDIPNRNEEILTTLFEGKYNKETGLFTPVIKNNGGFTPTVALKSDKLSDGTSIRFPRLENVLTDQRGVERFDSTCMGAYEMRCNAVDTVLKDTVMVGDSYTFIDKNLDDVCQKVGSYHFTETLKTEEGCDSIVKLSLAVRPQKNENGYYVKEDGTGDGSDWNNAMSPKDFAEYLPLVYDGETFHIAAGTYKSTYVDPELGRMYNINSSVTLIGGYPDTVTSTSTPSMPDVYVTKLTADVNGNDYTYYYPNSLEYTPYSNVKDNDSILIRVNGAKTLNLFGMTLSGVKSCDRGAVDLADGASLVMDRCFVQDNVASGVYGKGVDVKVTNSVFTHNYSNNGAAFNLADSKLNVQSTAVYENRAKVEECKSEYAMGGVANLENTEATFENSTLSNNAADMGSVFSVKSSKLDLTNNTIVGNQIIPESKHKGSFIGSLDDKSSVSLFGNIVIGNQNGEFDGVVNVASSDYNVFSYKTDMSYGSHDMVMNDPKEVQMLLDGDFAFESETVFIPNIQYNGGYTPTVAVIQSAFDGGKILNIPLDDRKVTYDQRGFVRKDSSCIGAFEFPTFMGYYVKKQAHGDGSGRDWENSMNDTTFAKYFSVVPTNASFYVAEGVYSPMFDSYGKLSTNKSRRYSSSRLVNIYGGYPDSAQTGCVADPVKYKTVLSVDYNGDDKYVVSDNDFTSIDVLNSQDNGYSIVNITSKFPGWVEINGVEFRGQSCVPRASSSAVQIFGYNVSGVNTRIEKCSFVGNYAAIYSGCDTTIIEECLFDSLDYGGLSVSSFSLSENNYLLVDKTTFANSLYQLSASSFRGLMRVQNSTFANALYGVTTPLDFMSTPENTKIEIYNNSFFSGKKEDCSLLVYDYIPVELKGNIISSKKLIVKPDQNGKYESKPIVSDYNVYTTEIDAYPLGENDTIVPQSSIGEIVKGVVENDIFEASLEDEGLYVKKLPTLINVKFEKGGGIKKMPKNATPVTDDQIGEIRPEVDYCVGAIEADCEFKKANFKLELAEEEICRDDTAKVTLTGLTKKEKATYKFAWTSSKDSVYVVDTFGNPGSFHVYARQALVPLQMTITNVCGVDTVLEIMQKVNGVGSVPFDGIEEGEVFCQNESEPVKLTTAVEGAIFTGECVVKKTDGYYFDASKAKGDSTRVRCSIQDGDCRSFDEKTIHFFKFDGDEAVEILASTQTKNVCMEKPQAQSVFTVTGWRDGLTCRLNGLASTLMDSTVTKDSVLTVTYGSLKNGEYIFVVSDECKPIASETIKIENEEIDPDMLKLSLDTVVANTQTCDGGEFGDVRVEYSGNINKADVVVVLSSLGTMVKSDTLSEEEAFVVFDNLKPAVYDVKIFFEGMEDCTIGDANYSRTVDVTKPVKFEVAFTATQAICENSIDAMMFTKTSGGNTPYTYKWTKYVGDIATSTVSHTKALHDTLPDLVKNEVYLCDVVDNYGCAASSDTLKIIYDHADSTLVDTFIYDPYQRCKGINNAQMIVDFDVVSEYAHPVYSLKEWNGKEYSEIDKNDADPALNKILLGALAPGKYKLHVGYPSVGCPALIDTTVEIKELVNDFKFEPADSIRMPRCYADNDAAIYFHAIGASRGLTATFSYKSNGKTLYKLSIDSLAGDTAYFVADNLPNDSFVVKMKNVCGEEITYEYNVGAPGFGIEMIDSISFKMLKCRYDSTGIIAFHINTGDYDSTKVTLRYSKPEEVIYVYDDTTYTTVDVPVYKIEPRVKDTIWNADSTDFDVRYERDPETNEIIIDTFVTYEKKDTMIIKKKNKPGIRYVEAVFPCKFDTVYGKDTTFIYSGLPGGGYFIDLVSTIKGCKDSVRIKDTIKIPNPVILSHEVLDISCKSKTDGVISLKPIRSGGRDRTFVLKHDSTFKDGKYEYEMCYIGYLIDGPSTVNSIGQEVKEKVFVNYEYDGCPLMTSLNRISNEAHLYKKDGDSYTQIQRYDIINPDKNLKQFLFGEEWKSIKWTKQDATGNYLDFTIVTPDSTTYEEDVYYSGPDTIKTAVWSYTHLPNFWKDEYGEWLESGVQTIANLSKGVYQCVVTDSNDCVYSTKISVVEPKDPLRIEEVTYDAEGALCDPTKRHIDMKVKGGWGDYNYMVMDGKNEGKGGLIDNYLAATSITYDTLNAMGVYRSQFLDPGKYRVAVVDGKGCRIEFEDEIEVKTNFTVEGSVKDAVCPGEESADATFVIHDAEKKYKYAVKEHIGSCDTPYDCVDDLNFVDCKVNFEGDGKTFTKKITGGGHGFFIYRLDPEKNDTSCGTYVRVSAIDTMKPMTLSKKSISHVTCNGLSNGSIELYVLGGKAPYIVDVNPSWGSEDVDMSKPDLYPTVDPKDTLGKFPRIVIDNLKARDYYFTITDSNKCHQRFGDTATHTAKLTVKEPDALSAEFAASSMCANAGAANDPNYGSVSALDVKGGTSPYLFSVKGGLDTERKFDDGTTEIYHSSIESDEPFIPVAGYKETTFYYTISDANGCELSTSLMFGQDEVKVSRQTDFLATTWSHYGDIIALIDFCGPESTFDSVSYKFSNEKVKLLDKRLYIYDLDNPKRGATPNAKNIVLSYYDTREVPDGFFIDNFNMAKDMTPLLASHINFVMVTDKSDLYTSTSHDANDSLYLKTDVIMSSYFKGCRYQVEINDFLKVAYDNVELYYGGVDRRKNILDIVVTPNPRTEGKPCTVNVYFANNTEDCVLTFYHMDGSEVDRVTIPAGQLKKTKYDYNDAYVYTYNVENERFNNVEVVVISAVTKYDSKGTILLNAGPAGE